ncbi:MULTISPECIES: hypothetical protein [Streptomyces]|uniref:Uncharacterized protein n=1 Tax=Streptomyces lasalocidi TaxID=324833 RepID=A0A4U5WHJ4_STRLS|nr:hypothetical protein [Streptomyces lasalocidi]TKS99945.1 hypothetical protein E4U91_07315 [Streptomyces lasalocidi]
MDGTAIIIVLAIAGVASVLLFALKGLLDQVPDVIDSAGAVRDAWQRFKANQDEAATPIKGGAIGPEAPEEPHRADDEEPPVTA